MKKERISYRDIGLSFLILILLLIWEIRLLSSLQGSLGAFKREKSSLVFITGEINNPGVYKVNNNLSLRELIDLAGGLKRKLTDTKWGKTPSVKNGEGIRITLNNGYISGVSNSMPTPYKITLQIPVSINTSNQEDLEAIPNIGPHIAKKIIEYRSLHGQFKDIEEIINIPGIGNLRYLKLKPFIGI